MANEEKDFKIEEMVGIDVEEKNIEFGALFGDAKIREDETYYYIPGIPDVPVTTPEEKLMFSIFGTTPYQSELIILKSKVDGHQGDADVMYDLIREFDARLLVFVSRELLNDEDFICRVIRKNVFAYRFLPTEVQLCRSILLTAIAVNHSGDPRSIDPKLEWDIIDWGKVEENRRLLLDVMKRHGEELFFLSPKSRSDREIVTIAIESNGRAFHSASEEFRADKMLALNAVRKCGKALGSASEDLQGDRAVVTVAVNQDGSALQYASPELRADKEIVSIAVNRDGSAFQYAAPELRTDKEILMLVVGNDGEQLKELSPELRADKDIVLAAVRQNGHALKYAAKKLKADKEVAIAAVKQDKCAFRYVAVDLQKDPDVRNANKS